MARTHGHRTDSACCSVRIGTASTTEIPLSKWSQYGLKRYVNGLKRYTNDASTASVYSRLSPSYASAYGPFSLYRPVIFGLKLSRSTRSAGVGLFAGNGSDWKLRWPRRSRDVTVPICDGVYVTVDDADALCATRYEYATITRNWLPAHYSIHAHPATVRTHVFTPRIYAAVYSLHVFHYSPLPPQI